MVIGNDLIKQLLAIYIYIFDLCFLNPDVYILKTEWYLDLYIAHCIYIFKRKNIADFLKNVCIYPGSKYETLNFALQLRLISCPACFYIIDVC